MKSILTVTLCTFLLLTAACQPPSTPQPPVETIQPGNPPAATEAPTDVIVIATEPVTTLDTTEVTASNSSSPEQITLDDNGKTFNLHVGDSFLLFLGMDTYDWTVSVQNDSALHLKMGVMVIRGAQGIYEALAPGTTTLTAEGSPLCLQSTPPCTSPSMLFTVTINVQ